MYLSVNRTLAQAFAAALELRTICTGTCVFVCGARRIKRSACLDRSLRVRPVLAIVEPRVLTGGLFLWRCWQDGYQVGERVVAGALMKYVPAFLAKQQKHLFRWAV